MTNLYRFFSGLGLMLLMTSSCGTLSRRLPPVDLRQPGWQVRQGQAVWKLPNSKHDIAGDVIVALGPAGQSFVQFSKTPFPLVIGQSASNRWQIEFPPQNRRYSGAGSPPRRAIWLYLPRALAGKALPAQWTWRDENGNWELKNPVTGEALEGYFAQ